jgi:CMP-N-acetylneuraminic acid synthetase
MIKKNGRILSAYAFIFARGGSKGVPGKNIRALAGKPLIAYSIDSALTSSYVDKVVVSTDSEEIAAIARQCGAEVPFIRPPELATDQSSEWLAWQHALEFLRQRGDMPDIFLSVPATSPLRDVADLDACVEKLVNGNFDIVITASEAARNPYFNMIRIGLDGGAELAVKPDKPIIRRQDAPQFYDMATVAYAAYAQFILEKNALFDGRVGCVVIPAERTVDIDTELDFLVADVLMREKEKHDA